MSSPHSAGQWGFKILLSWKQRQPRSVNKRKVLADALREVYRDDLAGLVDGNFKPKSRSTTTKAVIPQQEVTRQHTSSIVEPKTKYTARGVPPTGSGSDNPEDTDSEEGNSDDDSTKEFFEKWRNHDGVYINSSTPRGRCLIINNFKFEPEMRNRYGTEHDLNSLKDLFTKFKYTVTVKTDLTARDIKDTLNEESKQSMHDMYESFVLAILSHGTVDAVYGVDNETVPYKEIYNYFNGENCKSLIGKPKIIIIQACQGKDEDGGVVPDGGEVKQDDNVDASSPSPSDLMDEKDYPDGAQKSPTMADFFIATATTQDYVSWRNTQTGTWFIQALVHIYRKYAGKKDISAMSSKVNSLVASKTSTAGKKQIPDFRNRLRKKFYFFPGH
ncbi:unnamed protein product [Owenia fusiformis]|uniref:Uncharacterized protein n=1 Tax=Owenia fusiformis TaxID=6347 RepID=A0A8S4P3F6_OWEFU|nr:unnamed protein product [Owenia fusiformis]